MTGYGKAKTRADREKIEQAIARGASNRFLMDAWALTYHQLVTIKAGMGFEYDDVTPEPDEETMTAPRWPVGPDGLRPCGTERAYRRHRTRGEEPCDLCEQAHEVQKAWDRARKARQRKVDATDPAAVEAALLRGDVVLSPSGIAEAVAHLDRFGYSARVIAERLGITERTVQRHRQRRAA